MFVIRSGTVFEDCSIGDGANFQDFDINYQIGYTFLKKLAYGTTIFLKPRWHVPGQNLVNRPRWDVHVCRICFICLRFALS